MKLPDLFEAWASSIETQLRAAQRNGAGKADLFSAVGQAEYHGIDLAGAVVRLREHAAAMSSMRPKAQRAYIEGFRDEDFVSVILEKDVS